MGPAGSVQLRQRVAELLIEEVSSGAGPLAQFDEGWTSYLCCSHDIRSGHLFHLSRAEQSTHTMHDEGRGEETGEIDTVKDSIDFLSQSELTECGVAVGGLVCHMDLICCVLLGQTLAQG